VFFPTRVREATVSDWHPMKPYPSTCAGLEGTALVPVGVEDERVVERTTVELRVLVLPADDVGTT
jgi:hypothetical protein